MPYSPAEKSARREEQKWGKHTLGGDASAPPEDFARALYPGNGKGTHAVWFRANKDIQGLIDRIFAYAESLKWEDLKVELEINEDNQRCVYWVHGQPSIPTVALWIPPDRVEIASKSRVDAIRQIGRLTLELQAKTPGWCLNTSDPCVLIYPAQADLERLAHGQSVQVDGKWCPVTLGDHQTQAWHLDSQLGDKGASNFLFASIGSPWTEVSALGAPQAYNALTSIAKSFKAKEQESEVLKVITPVVPPPKKWIGSGKQPAHWKPGTAQGGSAGVTWDGHNFHRGLGMSDRQRAVVFFSGYSYQTMREDDSKASKDRAEFFHGKNLYAQVINIEEALKKAHSLGKYKNYSDKIERVQIVTKAEEAQEKQLSARKKGKRKRRWVY